MYLAVFLIVLIKNVDSAKNTDDTQRDMQKRWSPNDYDDYGMDYYYYNYMPEASDYEVFLSEPETIQPFLSECKGVKNYYNFKKNLTVEQCYKFNGFLYWRINEKCYTNLFHYVKVNASWKDTCFRFTWDEAEDKCRMVAGHLASRHTSEESNVVKLFVKYDNSGNWPGPWIGLHRVDFVCPKPFTYWSDGSRKNYTLWIPGDPNCWGGQESCVQIVNRQRGFGWNTEECFNPNEAICKVQSV